MGRANTTLVYSIADDSWSVNDAPLSIPRSDNCAAAVDGKLYTAGEPPLHAVIEHPDRVAMTTRALSTYECFRW